MMKKISILTSVLALTAFSSASFAGCASNVCVAVKVEQIFVQNGDSHVNVGTDGDETKLSNNCVADNGIYIRLVRPVADPNANYYDDGNYDETYSLLLAAKYSGGTVKIKTTPGPTGICEVFYVRAD